MNIAIILSVLALGSGIRVRNAQTAQQKGIQFKVMFAEKNMTEPEVITVFARQDAEGSPSTQKTRGPAKMIPLINGFQYAETRPTGLKMSAAKDFITKILTDLPADITEKLKTCSPSVKGNQNIVSPPAHEVWILMTLEKLEAHEVKAFTGWSTPDSKVLMIGQPGPGDDDFVTQRLRHIYIPSASIEFTETRRFTPMDLVNRDAPESNSMRFLSGKNDDHVFAYQHHNCRPYREQFFDAMCRGLKQNGLPCHALGRCRGGSGLAKTEDSHNDRMALDSDGRLMRDELSIDRYSKYKFVEAFEENAGVSKVGFQEGHGYISEKMMTSLLAGAVPVFAAGIDVHVEEVFNPEAILLADLKDFSKTSDRIAYLTKHPQEYEAMVKAPAVTDEQMKKFFTWHPATWPKYGDQLRMKIINEILSLCELP